MILSVLLGASSAHAHGEEATDAEPKDPDGSITEVVDHVVDQGARPAADAATKAADMAARDAARAVSTAVPQASPVTDPVLDRVVEPATEGVGQAIDAVGSGLVEATATVEDAVEDLPVEDVPVDEVAAEVLPAQPEQPAQAADPAVPADGAPGGQGRGVAGTSERAGSGEAAHLGDGVPGLHHASSAHPFLEAGAQSSIERRGSEAPHDAPCSNAASSASASGAGAGSLGSLPARHTSLEAVSWPAPAAASPALVSAPDGLPACTPD